jgi:hypothetical protein
MNRFRQAGNRFMGAIKGSQIGSVYHIQCVTGFMGSKEGRGLRQINTCRKVHLQVIFFYMTTICFGRTVHDCTLSRPFIQVVFRVGHPGEADCTQV